MTGKIFRWLSNHARMIIGIFLLVAAGVAGAATYPIWKPKAQEFIAYLENKHGEEEKHHDEEHHEDDDHEGENHVDIQSLEMSAAAQKNIGLTTGIVTTGDFVKEISVPAIVVERSGRSQIHISAPMTGIVTQVYPLEREEVKPGDPLFDLRLTHEDVVTAQSDLLKRLHDLDIVQTELNRLKSIGEGVIPGKRIIEQSYKVEEAENALSAIKQTLLLHGMSQEQIDNIEKTRQLLKQITVVAPTYEKDHAKLNLHHKFHVQNIGVSRGQSVLAGAQLGTLADHCLLYVEGQAFEDDAQRLIRTAARGDKIKVLPVYAQAEPDQPLELEFESISDEVSAESRALKFYLLLQNEPSQGASDSKGNFVFWKYRPGQRMEALIPTTGVMKNKIVLPPDALAIEGVNAYVFEQNGDHFDRIDVHVLYRDKHRVVLENDGTLLGSTIAMSGAYAMHVQLKNQSGGAVDPHAGHSHD